MVKKLKGKKAHLIRFRAKGRQRRKEDKKGPKDPEDEPGVEDRPAEPPAPQKRSKGDLCGKLVYCCSPEMQDLLLEYSVQTGGKAKKRGTLEGEATGPQRKLGT